MAAKKDRRQGAGAIEELSPCRIIAEARSGLLRLSWLQNAARTSRATNRGEVTERLKVLASKASVRETVPWVRIPPSPPSS